MRPDDVLPALAALASLIRMAAANGAAVAGCFAHALLGCVLHWENGASTSCAGARGCTTCAGVSGIRGLCARGRQILSNLEGWRDLGLFQKMFPYADGRVWLRALALGRRRLCQRLRAPIVSLPGPDCAQPHMRWAVNKLACSPSSSCRHCRYMATAPVGEGRHGAAAALSALCMSSSSLRRLAASSSLSLITMHSTTGVLGIGSALPLGSVSCARRPSPVSRGHAGRWRPANARQRRRTRNGATAARRGRRGERPLRLTFRS